MEKAKFPYTVKPKNANKGYCAHTVNVDAWRVRMCDFPVKEVIDGVGFCKTHSRSVKRWRGESA